MAHLTQMSWNIHRKSKSKKTQEKIENRPLTQQVDTNEAISQARKTRVRSIVNKLAGTDLDKLDETLGFTAKPLTSGEKFLQNQIKFDRPIDRRLIP